MIRRLVLYLGIKFYDLGAYLMRRAWRRDERNAKPKPQKRPLAVRPTLEVLIQTPAAPWVPKRPSDSWRWN